MTKKKLGASKDTEPQSLADMASAMGNRPINKAIAGVVAGATALVIVSGSAMAVQGFGNKDDAVIAQEDHNNTSGNNDDAVVSSESVAPTAKSSTSPHPSDGSSKDSSDASDKSEPGSDSGSHPAPTNPERDSALTGGHTSHSTDSVYIVQPNDTLSQVSAKLGISVDRLIAWNDIVDPNLIYEGSALEIPQR